jgi:two-component system sensor histidine kinase DesK
VISTDSDCEERRDTHETAVRGLWFGRRPRGFAQQTGALIWLAFIVFPLANAITAHGTAVHHALVIAGAAVFVAAYIALVVIWRDRQADRVLPALFLVLVAVAGALTLGDSAGWGFLFTYCAACAGLIAPRYGFAGVILCAALAGITSAIGGANGGQVVGWVASSLGIGMLILVMRDLRIRNDQLSEARAELARMAVAEERERFARDLHDLLGHSLSLIALKTELARRLLPERPDDAARELGDVEAVAREALSEVREAVSGFRRPTLDDELEGARMALAAADIRTSVDRADATIEPGAEAVLAWAVREGVTNVIRHSHADNCTLRVTAGAAGAAVEVTDDGAGPAAMNGHAGSGLAGLEQRARDVGGKVEAGALPGGGFRLAVTVPPAKR